MNLDTMEREIAETLQLLASSSATQKVRHRILSSIRFHREKRYFFSERTFTFVLAAGRWEYRPGDGHGLPGDLVEIIGNVLWLTPEGSDQRTPLDRLDRQEMDWRRGFDASSIGEPSEWDWFEGALRLTPIPDAADTISGPYVRDLGVPQKKWNAATSAWEFFTPNGAATLTGDFTNHWFDPLGGYELIKERALSLVYKDVLQDEGMANQHMTTWLEEKGRLEDETEGKSSPMSIPPALW